MYILREEIGDILDVEFQAIVGDLKTRIRYVCQNKAKLVF